MIRKGYDLLGLQTYFTAGKKKLEHGPLKIVKPHCTGVIHSDFERGFICVEVYKIKDLVKVGNVSGLKEKGLIQIQGKEYILEEVM